MADEVKLEWVEKNPGWVVLRKDGRIIADLWCQVSGWTSQLITTGTYYGDLGSTKAAVIAELLLRNESGRVALEGLK